MRPTPDLTNSPARIDAASRFADGRQLFLTTIKHRLRHLEFLSMLSYRRVNYLRYFDDVVIVSAMFWRCFRGHVQTLAFDTEDYCSLFSIIDPVNELVRSKHLDQTSPVHLSNVTLSQPWRPASLRQLQLPLPPPLPSPWGTPIGFTIVDNNSSGVHDESLSVRSFESCMRT